MTQAYSDPRREDDPHALPDIEIFEAQVMECSECGLQSPDFDETEGDKCYEFGCDGRIQQAQPVRDGWWWWSCFPGCLPDGDPIGPFDTEAEALADAREGLYQCAKCEAWTEELYGDRGVCQECFGPDEPAGGQ